MLHTSTKFHENGACVFFIILLTNKPHRRHNPLGGGNKIICPNQKCADPASPLWFTLEFGSFLAWYMFTSLTRQSALPTEAVEARRAIKGFAAATKTKPIHLRPQRDRMQATYSSPKPAHKNSRKKRLGEGAAPRLLKCATSKLFWFASPSIFEGRLSSTAVCPVVDGLLPLSLCLYFPVETDTVLLFSWAKLLSCGAQGTGPLAVPLLLNSQRLVDGQ